MTKHDAPEAGRNRYVLALEVEMTEPIDERVASAAASLLARDVRAYLVAEGWGYGVARVESVYAPDAQFEHGDFNPEAA